jgi:hypothetical protein
MRTVKGALTQFSRIRKITVPACLNKHHAVEDVWGTGGIIPALNGVEQSASRPGLFTPREKAPITHWI